MAHQANENDMNDRSTIGVARIGDSKQSVLDAVSEAMELASWKKYLVINRRKPKKVFIKVNLLSFQVVPGHCTSPWVLEAVLKKLKEETNFKIFVGDANVATIKQIEKGSINWDYVNICKNYGAKFVNLSKEEIIEQDFHGAIFHRMYFPKILTQMDYIITLPVPKTHNVAGMTCALKNQWGCIPTFRHQYHDRVQKAIAEINKALAVRFVVCDATVGSEGEGPRTSTPIACDHVFASHDLVAMDSFIAEFIGINKKEIQCIDEAERLKLGSSRFALQGDTARVLDKNNKVISRRFKKPVLKHHPIVFLEMKLRKVPVLSYLLFKTVIFKIPAFLASRYNSIYWYYRFGKKEAQAFIDRQPVYREEFQELIDNQR
jgi:uncharacterized protein (DUF362 family)